MSSHVSIVVEKVSQHIMSCLPVSLSLLFVSVVSTIQISEAAVNVNFNNTQIWTNGEQNLKIQFSYQPQKPILDQPTVIL